MALLRYITLGEVMSWLRKFFYKFFVKSERKIFDKSDLVYKDSDNTWIELKVLARYPGKIFSD